jgi:glutathione S-transferase
MTTNRQIVLYHSPNTRSSIALTLLEELGVPYDLEVIDLKAGEQQQPAYLAVNPMGKVPAIRHGDAIVTEQVAIFLYLADLFPEASLAPALNSPMRGPYLRWMVFYAACFEPAIGDNALNRPAGPPGQMGYGDFDRVMKTISDQLAKGTYLLGEKFTAADILWGNGLTWTKIFGLLPEDPVVDAYIARHKERPSVARANAIDADLEAGLND